MKYIVITIATLLSIISCSSTTDIDEKIPLDTTTQVENCAADGVGCKQFNPNL